MRRCDVAIRRLLVQHSFDPEEVAVLVAAYEKAIETLQLSPDQYHPAKEVIAMKVIELGRSGLKDPERIALQIVHQYQNPAAGC
jgi:hypothetical protein